MLLSMGEIPQEVYETKKIQKSLRIYPIWITVTYHDYIIDLIMYRVKIEFYRQINIENK